RLSRAVLGGRAKSAAGRHVQSSASGAALERLARAQELLRPAPPCAPPRASARAAQARCAPPPRRSAEAFPEPGADARIRVADTAQARAGALAGAAAARRDALMQRLRCCYDRGRSR